MFSKYYTPGDISVEYGSTRLKFSLLAICHFLDLHHVQTLILEVNGDFIWQWISMSKVTFQTPVPNLDLDLTSASPTFGFINTSYFILLQFVLLILTILGSLFGDSLTVYDCRCLHHHDLEAHSQYMIYKCIIKWPRGLGLVNHKAYVNIHGSFYKI